MNIYCPNCQKMLSVAEQFAGQPMKCPLCNGTFTVPALAPPAAAPPPPPPTPPSAPAVEVYPLAQEPSPAPSAMPPPVPPPLGPQPAATAAPEPVPVEVASQAPAAPADYARTFSVALRPEVVPWVAPVALLVVFFLLFFNWVGIYPGGFAAYTQNAWQALGGSFSADPVAEKTLQLEKRLDVKFSGLMLVYVLLFLLALLLALAMVVLRFVPVRLPPAVTAVWAWRSAILAGLAVLAFLFLVWQLFAGFNLENAAETFVSDRFKAQRERAKTPEEKAIVQMEEGGSLGTLSLQRTAWLRLAVFLQLVALAGMLLEHWLERRRAKPPPRIDVMW
jgi:hypothetical protein